MPYHIFLAEPTKVWCDESPRFSALNNIANVTFDCGYATSTKLLDWFTKNNLKHLDVLDVDIQGGEEAFVPEVKEFAKNHVKVFIIGTHSKKVHEKMLTLLSDSGDSIWEIISTTPERGSDPCTTSLREPSKENLASRVNATPRCQLFNTRFGNLIQWDGEIIAINSHLVPPEDIAFYRG